MRAVFKSIIKFLREADIFLLVLSLISSIYGIILISSIVVGVNSAAMKKDEP